MTLSAFQKKVKTTRHIVWTFPFISALFNHWSGIPFPPMGDDSVMWRFVATVIVGGAAFLPFFLFSRMRRMHAGLVIAALFVLMAISCAVYVTTEQRYVVAIPYSTGSTKFVIRGSQRNRDLGQRIDPQSNKPYVSMGDADLIRNSGQTDLALEKAYTKESLQANRQKLFWSYVTVLVLLELLLASIVKAE